MGFAYFEVKNVWNQIVTKWKYIIQKGDNASNLPSRLWLESKWVFYKLWLKLFAPNINLQAWTYTISNDTILNNVFLNNLKKPDSLDQEITILPWWNIFDIDKYISDKWIIKKWELITLSNDLPQDLVNRFKFLKWHTLEWFLYPDTYRLQFNISAKDLVSVLLNEFNDKIFEKYWSNSWDKFYNTLILASIVEKEERNISNKPIVAWILAKRLKEGIAIWADATVCYAYNLTYKECTPAFIWEKIYIKSEYNTRNKLWLPPTPISNLSDNSFEAAFEPEKSEYYYYLHDNEWQIHYWKTLNDHNRNKNLYLK